MTEDEIISRINQLYPGAIMEVSGEDCNFELYIISEEFKGKTIIQRQQSILNLFKNELAKGTLHALSIKAKTPEDQQQQSGLVQIKI